MAVNVIITDAGVNETISAMNTEGYYVKFTQFSMSRSKGAFVATRTAVNNPADVWYGPQAVTAYTQISNTTLQLTLSIPQNATLVTEEAQEIYIWAEDQSNNEFLFAIAQPDPVQYYDPVALLTFKIQFALTNVDISSTYNFNSTIAQELQAHDADDMAHPALRARIELLGAYVLEAQRIWSGQGFDQFPTIGTSVADGEAVYWDTGDSEYDQAIENNTAAQFAVGIYNATKDIVVFSGVVPYTHSLDPLSPVYLSTSTAGGLTTSEGRILIGYALPNNTMYVSPMDTDKIGGGGKLAIKVNQTAHGFSVGEQVFHNGTAYEKADNTDPDKLRQYTVVEVVGPNDVKIQKIGQVKVTGHGFTIGEYYFSDDATAGAVTVNQPNGGYNSPAFYVIDVDNLDIFSYVRSMFLGTVAPDELNLGDPTVDGSYRLRLSGGNLVIEKRESGVWNLRDTIN